MSARVDPATAIDTKGRAEPEVDPTARRWPVIGLPRFERRMIPMGKDDQPRPVLIEWRRRRVRW